MDRRLELHEKLCNFLGSRFVYYQPPESKKLEYPCIVYKLDQINSKFANDAHYLDSPRYSATLIYSDPDSNLPYEFMQNFNRSSLNRRFAANGLNHSTFTLYY